MTDHSALSWAPKFQTPMGQINRFINTLSLYDFEVEYRSDVDILSRNCGLCKQCKKLEINDRNKEETEQCIATR